MALLRIAAARNQISYLDGRIVSPDSLRRAVPQLRKNAPIIVLIHGFMMDVRDRGSSNPNCFLYHFNAERSSADRYRRSVSWPLGLGFSEERDDGKEGLCIALGWQGRDSLGEAWGRGRRRFGLAYEAAGQTGSALAKLFEVIAEAYPERQVDVFAHSLGARVALSALATVPNANLGRFLLLNPAEFTEPAIAAMTCAGSAAPEVFSFSSRENAFFDILLEQFAPRSAVSGERARHSLGRRREPNLHPSWLDIRLCAPSVQNWLTAQRLPIQGYRIACHWGVYNRPEMMALYARLLRQPSLHPINELRAALCSVPDSSICNTLDGGFAPQMRPA